MLVFDMPDPSLLIYDGECVLCANYVRFARLKAAVGPVELLDARSGDPRLKTYWDQYDLDQGMLFDHRGQVYYGSDAVHVLATLSSKSGLFNRLNARMFASPKVAKAAYPFLKFGRDMSLLLRGRGRLKAADLAN
jgi:predicted DCC family thiol-disulfide oxidoreductase YuxK